MSDIEDHLESLRAIAHQEAARRLTASGGHEVEDVIQGAIADYLDYSARNTVENPGGLIRVMARFRAMKVRDRWEAKRDDSVIDGRKGDRGRAVEIAVEGHDPLAAIVARNEADLVAYAVEKLGDVDREIARLTYLTEPPLTAPAIAGRLDLKPGTVRNRLVGIRRTLAQLLDFASD